MARRHVIKDVAMKGLDPNKPYTNMHKGTLIARARELVEQIYLPSIQSATTSPVQVESIVYTLGTEVIVVETSPNTGNVAEYTETKTDSVENLIVDSTPELEQQVLHETPAQVQDKPEKAEKAEKAEKRVIVAGRFKKKETNVKVSDPQAG